MQCYDFIMAGVMYIISGIMFYNMKSITTPDSKILPSIVAVILIILASCLILSRIRQKKEKSYNFTGSSKGFILVGILLVYAICSELFGFYVCTPFFLVLSMIFLGQRKKVVLILVPVITTIAVMILFEYIFQIPLPDGTVFNIFDFIR